MAVVEIDLMPTSAEIYIAFVITISFVSSVSDSFFLSIGTLNDSHCSLRTVIPGLTRSTKPFAVP